MQAEKEWYIINNIEQLDSPALVVFPDRVKSNVQKALALIGDATRLRPHVKTHKCTEVTKLMLAAGIRKFKCATIAEAEMLALAGAPDVLMAYQPVGPKVLRFISLMQQFPATQFSCLVDNGAAAEAISQLAVYYRTRVSVYLDLNIGMDRTGVKPNEAALRFFCTAAALPGLALVGLHAYDGHITDSDLEQRTRRCHEAFAPVFRLNALLEEKGFTNLNIVGGGSPTFPILAKMPGLECSPGTFVYWDAGYLQAYPDQPFQPAAVLVSRVVSLPAGGLVCTDLGHKSVAAENPLHRRLRLLNAADVEFVSQSEEHLVFRTGSPLQLGEVLYAVPVHICPTCALYERVAVVENGHWSAAWKTVARDRQLTI